jgi:5'(3')-deoxyribonucleotidase
MKIIVDVDCVVADFVGAVLALVGRPECREEANQWDWWKKYPIKERIIVDEAVRTREFWQNLPLVEDAVEGINFLRANGHEIIWVTAPYKHCPVWVDARYKWLETHFKRSALEEPVIYTKYKYLIKATCMIDDRAMWLEEWERHWKSDATIGFLFGTELNDDINRERVNWQDIMNMRFFHERKHIPRS